MCDWIRSLFGLPPKRKLGDVPTGYSVVSEEEEASIDAAVASEEDTLPEKRKPKQMKSRPRNKV